MSAPETRAKGRWHPWRQDMASAAFPGSGGWRWVAWFSAQPARAASVRLLVLGDSLAAGYGLAHEDAFETRLAEALKTRRT